MENILQVKDLKKVFHQHGKRDVTAVENMSFSLRAGEILGIVGESGSGKSTVAKLITRLEAVTEGQIILDGQDITHRKGRALKSIYDKIQMVFQNPVGSFDPRKTLGYGIGESLKNRGVPKEEIRKKTANLLEQCGLEASYMDRYPHQVSGGQCQRAAIARALAIHQFFQERGFVYVHTPLITGSDCEGAGEMFQVTTMDLNNVPKTEDGKVDYSQDFFGKETNLTVSGQLNGETYAMAFRDIYTFGPTFRAENSNTTRHAAEFWMIEPEMAFADLEDNMEVAEAMLKYVISYVLENAPEEMNFFNQFVDKGLLDRLHGVLNSEFGHVTYTEAIEILEKNNDNFDYKVSWGCDLQTEHERYLTEQVFKRPIFVTDYPKDIKAFYMKLNEDGKTVAAMDCLVPGIGEIIGGSQREDDLGKLTARMQELGLKEEHYGFYLDLRKYGSVRHSGFGLGFERCVMYLTGMGNIRDVIPFPRTVNNCEL